MISIDANILLRLITKDDPVQLKIVERLMDSTSVYILDTVWLETAWVLKSVYKIGEKDIASIFLALLVNNTIKVRNRNQLKLVCKKIMSGMDLADAFHAVLSGKKSFKTFDRKLVNAANMPNVTLLK